jgi:aspartyl-tRNA(Asn)/glutamyl-tRNA(Gln) amidotransferase subunit A
MTEDISELAALLRSGNLTAVQLLDQRLEKIHRIDPKLNSFVFLDETGARVAAQQSDARFAAGAPRSALEGIPLSIKDNILVKGMPATWGSRSLADFIPERDELPVDRLRNAGAIMVGKTNVPELTLEGYTKNDLFGVTRNPWDTRLTPGGSSGGAAASVAAGLVPAAVGTDGGGSIRRPACHTGLVGWKPSVGQIPRVHGFPAILTDFETVGTLTRTVDDALILGAVMTGPDGRDRRSLYASSPPWSSKKLKILYVPSFGESPVDPEVAAATKLVARMLGDEGHAVIQEEVFFDLEDAARIWHVVSRSGVAWLTGREGGKLGKLAGASVQAMAQEGQKLTAADYIDALERVAAFRRRCAELFARADLVLTPTAAALPWPAETPYPDRIADRRAGPRDHAVFTGWVNIAGLPAISLPVATSGAGLPIGVQFTAGFGMDAALLAFAKNIEQRYPPPRSPLQDEQP